MYIVGATLIKFFSIRNQGSLLKDTNAHTSSAKSMMDVENDDIAGSQVEFLSKSLCLNFLMASCFVRYGKDLTSYKDLDSSGHPTRDLISQRQPEWRIEESNWGMKYALNFKQSLNITLVGAWVLIHPNRNQFEMGRLSHWLLLMLTLRELILGKK